MVRGSKCLLRAFRRIYPELTDRFVLRVLAMKPDLPELAMERLNLSAFARMEDSEWSWPGAVVVCD